MDRRALLINAALGFTGVAAGYLLHRTFWTEAPEVGEAPDVAGVQLPDFAFSDRSGTATALRDLPSPMLLNFWAAWCGPCRVEIPELMRVAKRHPHMTVVGLALDRPEAVWRFVDEHAVDYPILVHAGDASEVHAAFGNADRLLPYSVLVVDGVLIAAHLGALTEADVDGWAALAG